MLYCVCVVWSVCCCFVCWVCWVLCAVCCALGVVFVGTHRREDDRFAELVRLFTAGLCSSPLSLTMQF